MSADPSPRPRNPVARKINRERIVLLGWGRAILLQIAHPLVAQGVFDHSLFDRRAGRYLARAWRTVSAMLSLTFGTEAEAAAVAGRINAVHIEVQGTLRRAAGVYPAGTPYSARDPELLRWVHATLVESLPMAYEQFVGPLTADEKDRYCVEAGAAASLLGLPPDAAPADWAELTSYMEDMLGSSRIAVTEPARSLAEALLAPRLGPVTPLFRLARLATIGLLPASVRQGYGFAWDEGRVRAFERAVRVVRRARAVAPVVVREWPAARAA